MKSGIKTTEFWMSLLSMGVGAVMTIFSSNQWVQAVGGIVVALTGGAYSVARGNAKAALLRGLSGAAEALSHPPQAVTITPSLQPTVFVPSATKGGVAQAVDPEDPRR